MSSKYKTAQEILDEGYEPEFKKEKIRFSISKDDILKRDSREKQNLNKDKDSNDEAKEVKKPKPKKKKTKRSIPIKPQIKKLFGVLDESDKNAIRKFLIYSGLNGLLLNFSLFVIIRVPFTFYSWFGWGIGLWFIENKLVNILRRIIRK